MISPTFLPPPRPPERLHDLWRVSPFPFAPPLSSCAHLLDTLVDPTTTCHCVHIGRKHIAKPSGCQMRMMMQFSSFFFFPLLSSLLARSHTGRYMEDISLLFCKEMPLFNLTTNIAAKSKLIAKLGLFLLLHSSAGDLAVQHTLLSRQALISRTWTHQLHQKHNESEALVFSNSKQQLNS